ncbi:hypothetical protein [Haloprofundus salinisoli]|uniref:hypothetical protein n=1 Tax=Haloprofundus salinisoli TaxID=2876193 RepID=UPI001CCE90F7|nr:hypothetical protein [Haloprofundus salinisoli]
MPSFFDPGHGFLSSIDEIAVAFAAIVLFIVAGALAEYLGNARGGTVVGALVGYVAVLLYWAPAVFADEWHYALVAAVPVVALVYLYRGRRDRR